MCNQPCSGCALTPGAAANLEAENNLTALICVWGPLPFWCHDSIDWQKETTIAEKRREIRDNGARICQGWKREVQRLNAIGFYDDHRAARKAFAVIAIEQLQIMKGKKFSKKDKVEAKKNLEFYVKELCLLEMKRISRSRQNGKKILL